MTVEKADNIIAAVLQADPDFDDQMIDKDVEDINFYEDNLNDDLDVFKFIDEESNKDQEITNIVKDFMSNEDFTANIISIQTKPIKTELNQNCVKLTSIPSSVIIKHQQPKSKPVMITCPPVKTKAASSTVPTRTKKVILADKNSGGIAFQNEYQKYIRTTETGVGKKKVDNKENEKISQDKFKIPHAVTLSQYKHRQQHRPKIQLLPPQPQQQQQIQQNANATPEPGQKNQTTLPPDDSTQKLFLKDFHSIEEADSDFIGDYGRMFDTFQKIEDIQHKDRRNIESLDTWGGSEDVPRGLFDFDLDYELLGLGIPADWKDVEVFSGLDRMKASEKEFQYHWLPKTAPPAPRKEYYRQILRNLNTADPNFNIKMKLVG